MARTCTALPAYMKWARVLKKKYGMSTIFLATDSQHVIRATKGYPEFTFLTIDDHENNVFTGKRHGLIWDDLVKKHGSSATRGINPTAEAKQVIADMLLLSQCDALVGKFTSNVFRIAFQLSVARSPGGCAKPYVSLDGPWCFDYAVQFSGNGEGNRRFWC